MMNNHFVEKEEIDKILPEQICNINIGIVGHIDSGKTSLCRVLTHITSTASLDKNPYSKLKGITVDLGFSAFFLHNNPTETGISSQFKYIQYTLVDCPGHASLIRQVLGGSSIIDIIIIVIDTEKGIQVQTAECIALAELLQKPVLVALNKMELVSEEILTKKTEGIQKGMTQFFPKQSVNVYPITCCHNADTSNVQTKNIDMLVQGIYKLTKNPTRLYVQKPFFYLIDHCFPLKGQGSVVTGTVIRGKIKTNDDIEFPIMGVTKKAKNLQIFHKNAKEANQGDRVAILVTQLSSTEIERGIGCKPGYLKPMSKILVNLEKVKYFKREINSKSKYHITCGHQTIMGHLVLISAIKTNFSQINLESAIENENIEEMNHIISKIDFQYAKLYDSKDQNIQYFAVIELEKPMYAPLFFRYIGSKLDLDAEGKECRLGFYGRILSDLQSGGSSEEQKSNEIAGQNIINVIKIKSKKGTVERVIDSYLILVTDLFKKETNLQIYMNKKVTIGQNKLEGAIFAPFGQSGKVKVQLSVPLYSNEEEKQDAISKIINNEVNMQLKVSVPLK